MFEFTYTQILNPNHQNNSELRKIKEQSEANAGEVKVRIQPNLIRTTRFVCMFFQLRRKYVYESQERRIE